MPFVQYERLPVGRQGKPGIRVWWVWDGVSGATPPCLPPVPAVRHCEPACRQTGNEAIYNEDSHEP